jgi:HEPN domain-containing protein
MAAHAADNLRVREIVGFHCQQAAEKYLKALLTRRQVEFPRTHDIRTLLELVGDPLANSLNAAKWLTPFGVGIRYPGDSAEMLPGDENKAIEIACHVKRAVLVALARD